MNNPWSLFFRRKYASYCRRKEVNVMGKVHKDIRLQIQKEYMSGLKDFEIAKKLNINFVDVVKVLNPNY